MLSSTYIRCPFCGEKFEAVIDTYSGDSDYVEDCPVCCKPIQLHLRIDENNELSNLFAERDD